MLEKEFVKYNEALALKELGFDEFCFGYYKDTKLITLLDSIANDSDKFYNGNNVELKNDINRPYATAPTYSQAFKWFDKNYDLTKDYGVFPHHTIMMNYMITGGEKELAELECLKKLIEIVKNK